ncbi:MAG: DNA-processing protein DprA [Chroococcales cyanobacterium]
MLPTDTQAILLLCASFGQNRQSEPQPLTLREYNTLAGWLMENEMSPKNLLDSNFQKQLPKITIGKLDSQRLAALLERGVMLSLAVEKWTNQGLWILGRSDADYPKRLKQKLKHSAPPILYGVGNVELLSQGGLAVVGSRDIDEEGLNYTQNLVQTCVQEAIQVVSGGARGVDQASMLGALEAGGTAVGVMADSLAKAAVAGKYRSPIKEGRLTLISPYDPSAGFSVGNAMGRNKYIYALSDYALVINSSVGKGGTWAGATEALAKIQDVPVFVRKEGKVPPGNYELLKKGAKPFPETPWDKPLQKILTTAISEVNPVEESSYPDKDLLNSPEVEEEKTSEVTDNLSSINIQIGYHPKDIYEAVLPFILEQLEQPKDDKSLAECLDVKLGQVRDWLNRAVSENKVIKHKKPVSYEVNRSRGLLSLLESGE